MPGIARASPASLGRNVELTARLTPSPIRRSPLAAPAGAGSGSFFEARLPRSSLLDIHTHRARPGRSPYLELTVRPIAEMPSVPSGSYSWSPGIARLPRSRLLGLGARINPGIIFNAEHAVRFSDPPLTTPVPGSGQIIETRPPLASLSS